MRIGDNYIVSVEKISNTGLAICRVEGFVVFVANACPGDELNISITRITKNYAKAKIIEIIRPSKHRVNPFCSMQSICGACQLQFIDYDYQLEIKRQIVKDSLYSIANIEFDVPLTIPSPQNVQYRYKVQYPVAQTKVSKRILAGYYRQKTHEIVNIKYCPIHPKICDEVIENIRVLSQEYNISGYDEQTHSGDLKHIVLRVSSDTGKMLVTLVLNSHNASDSMSYLANALYNKFDAVVGVCFNYNPKQTNVILSDNTECICGKDFIEEKILYKTFKIASNTFFQVNPKSAENIFSYVREEVRKIDNPAVLDAYAGIAAFGVLLSDVAKEIVSVESNNNAVSKAREVLEINNIHNVDLHAKDTVEYLASSEKIFDISVIDPPRKGCEEQALAEILKHTKNKIIYVSCNPSTLARDLKYLLSKGCKLESVQPFDMFCHTYHVETVAVLNV